MGSIINRVKQVATYYNTSVVKWEETLGLSPSHFYNIKAISRRTARNINKVYPSLNIIFFIPYIFVKTLLLSLLLPNILPFLLHLFQANSQSIVGAILLEE